MDVEASLACELAIEMLVLVSDQVDWSADSLADRSLKLVNEFETLWSLFEALAMLSKDSETMADKLASEIDWALRLMFETEANDSDVMDC